MTDYGTSNAKAIYTKRDNHSALDKSVRLLATVTSGTATSCWFLLHRQFRVTVKWFSANALFVSLIICVCLFNLHQLSSHIRHENHLYEMRITQCVWKKIRNVDCNNNSCYYGNFTLVLYNIIIMVCNATIIITWSRLVSVSISFSSLVSSLLLFSVKIIWFPALQSTPSKDHLNMHLWWNTSKARSSYSLGVKNNTAGIYFDKCGSNKLFWIFHFFK